MPLLMALGVNTPFLILKLLNVVAPSDLHTPFADTVGLDGVPAWQQIERLLNNATTPLH